MAALEIHGNGDSGSQVTDDVIDKTIDSLENSLQKVILTLLYIDNLHSYCLPYVSLTILRAPLDKLCLDRCHFKSNFFQIFVPRHFHICIVKVHIW